MVVVPQSPIFRDEDKAREWLEARAWPNGPICPHCGNGKHMTQLAGSAHRAGLYQCNAPVCRQQFTVTVGTVFAQSKIPLHKWLAAIMLLSLAPHVKVKNVQRFLNISYKSTWHLVTRLRAVMLLESHQTGASRWRPSPLPDESASVMNFASGLASEDLKKNSRVMRQRRASETPARTGRSRPAEGELEREDDTSRTGRSDKPINRPPQVVKRTAKPDKAVIHPSQKGSGRTLSIQDATRMLEQGIRGPDDDPLFAQFFAEWRKRILRRGRPSLWEEQQAQAYLRAYNTRGRRREG
jgi:transposase-like protein